MSKVFTAIGLMSGTSMDGVDAAILRTDGEELVERTAYAQLTPFSDEEKSSLLSAKQKAEAFYREFVNRDADPQDLAEVQAALSQHFSEAGQFLLQAYERAISGVLDQSDMKAADIDFIGAHGQTILHLPNEYSTMQLLDGKALAERSGIPVVFDLRSSDVAAGGQGAPLVPIYHQALVRSAGLERPVAVVNVGGVANVTYVGADEKLIAFDTGPGNALIDDWMALKTGEAMDRGGVCARGGKFSERVLGQLLADPYFSLEPPKSLDRDHFKRFALPLVQDLSTEMGARTLTVFTVMSVAKSDFFFPMPPRNWIISGGGARNETMMDEFRKRLDGEICTADDMGWSSDFMEAEAFAYLAVRSSKGLPLTFPATTGISEPMSGGRLAEPVGR